MTDRIPVVSAPATEGFQLYARAFDGLAATYDRDFSERPEVRKLRRRIWERLGAEGLQDRFILEVGCGTGEDALFLASRGARVLAVDVSPAMVERARQKLRLQAGGAGRVPGLHHPKGRVRVEVCALEELESRLPGYLHEFDHLETMPGGPAPFDAVLSNFGALNCLKNLEDLWRAADAFLRPGGTLWLCMINRFCLRELTRGVLRRLRPSGTPVRCGSLHLPLYYHPVRRLRRPGYTLQEVLGLSVLRRDDLQSSFPLNRLGDHYLVVLRKISGR